MGLCDRLEAARTGRERGRDWLTAASLARLNVPDPETFQDDARFALDALPALTTRPDQIKGLRQTILNLAVRGKLVPQDPNDEPASEFFKRFTKERQRRGKSARAGSLQQVAAATSLPEGWTDATLSELAIFENGDRSSNYPSGTDILGSGVAFFSTKNLSDHQLRFTNLDYISEAKFASFRSGKLKDRDILVTLRGSVGKFGLFRASEDVKTGFINAQLLIVRSLLPEFVDFLLTFMKSETFSTQLETRASGSATPQLSAWRRASPPPPPPTAASSTPC
jgi:type I restriction enzyme, S subunit